ncbi:zinc finger protein 287 [Zeugodacus cucurbitae]|uniref:zinc finger protein 287 n=1 Tax=Zeugodacus cucurbitae TaxID=28588 RepID=UPI0023D8E65C|nr:zinc finger protein 287 [Zeugodacus cucurbitae]
MEIELNSGNLRNLCRICLGAGDYNLWEHKVNWSDNATENDSLESDTQVAETITIHEVLQMYNDWQHTILELDVELQLICKECLHELQPQYQFYKRLRAANKQITQLYEEALQQEAGKATITPEPVVTEHVEYDNNLVEYLDYATEQPQTELHVKSAQCVESIVSAPLQVQTTLKQTEKRKFAKNPKFILTGGVTQLLTHATGATTFEPPVEAITQQSDTHTLYSPHKRKRKGDDVELHKQLEKKERSNHNFFREHIPNVIDEGCTTNDYIIEQKEQEEIAHEVPPNELIEYATGEQYQTLITSNHIEKPLEIENDAEAALPFSTVSADDAGRSIYVCKYCPQAFTAPCFLLTHARKSHVCTHCSKAYVKTTDLFAHLRESHKDYKCKYCGKELSSNGNLRAHIKRIHPLTTSDIQPTHIIKNFVMGNSKEDSGDGGGENIYIDDAAQHIAEYLD